MANLWEAARNSAAVWLAAYFLAYVLTTHLLWCVPPFGKQRLQHFVSSYLQGWPWQTVRLIYCVLLPYVALLRGVVSPKEMGLTDLDWLPNLGWGLVLTVGGWALLSWGWRGFVQTAAEYPCPENLVLADASRGWSYALREAACYQMSWAFYRTAFVSYLGLYHGVFLALGVLFLAGVCDPATRSAWNLPGKREALLHTASLALVTALVFLFTGNLWICIASHVVLQIAMARHVFQLTNR